MNTTKNLTTALEWKKIKRFFFYLIAPLKVRILGQSVVTQFTLKEFVNIVRYDSLKHYVQMSEIVHR